MNQEYKMSGDNQEVSTKGQVKRQFTIREMVIIGLLSAVVITLGLTPFGLIRLGALNATTMHIPVLIGALVEGPKVGVLVGLIYGLFSWWSNMTQPSSLLSPLFMNPLVSVLPRLLFPIFAAFFFWANPMKALGARLMIAAFLGTLVQTVLVMGTMYLFFADEFAKLMDVSTSLVGLTIFGLGASHGLPEALIAGVVVTAIALPLRKMLGKDKKKGLPMADLDRQVADPEPADHRTLDMANEFRQEHGVQTITKEGEEGPRKTFKNPYAK